MDKIKKAYTRMSGDVVIIVARCADAPNDAKNTFRASVAEIGVVANNGRTWGTRHTSGARDDASTSVAEVGSLAAWTTARDSETKASAVHIGSGNVSRVVIE